MQPLREFVNASQFAGNPGLIAKVPMDTNEKEKKARSEVNTEHNWITKAIAAARSVGSITDDTASTIKEALAGAMSERALTQGELRELACKLVESTMKTRVLDQ